MENTERGHVSLFHHNDADVRVFLFTLAASILIHLAFVVALIFASEYSPAPPLSTSVIDVTMVTLPESQGGFRLSPVEPAVPAAEPVVPAERMEDLSQAELEALLMEQQASLKTPDPVPETPPAPEPPTEPAPATEQVVIDPQEPREPVKKPEPEKQAPAPPEKPAPAPVKTPKFTKPSKPPKAVETPQPDQESVRKAIAEIQKKIARRTEGRYRAASESVSEGGNPPARDNGLQTEGEGEGEGNGSAGSGVLGIQAKAAITSYAGSVLPDRINRNWAFSEHLASRRFNLEAVLVIKIRGDGEIVNIWFEKKSGDRYFDNSAYNAVVKSNPLPPLPQAYTSYADTFTIGLRFTPSGLN